MSESIHLQEASAADIDTMLRIVHTAFEEYRGRLDPPSGAHKETADTLRQALQTGAAATARLRGEIVGCVFYSARDEYVYIGRLSVLPTFRRLGVGEALMKYAEQRARDLGFRRVQIGVRIALPHLKAFYERHGYTVVRLEAHPGYAKPTSIVMEKDVD